MFAAAKIIILKYLFKAADSLVDYKIFMFSNGASTKVNGYFDLKLRRFTYV